MFILFVYALNSNSLNTYCGIRINTPKKANAVELGTQYNYKSD